MGLIDLKSIGIIANGHIEFIQIEIHMPNIPLNNGLQMKIPKQVRLLPGLVVAIKSKSVFIPQSIDRRLLVEGPKYSALVSFLNGQLEVQL